jgi:hypothetical protein
MKNTIFNTDFSKIERFYKLIFNLFKMTHKQTQIK